MWTGMCWFLHLFLHYVYLRKWQIVVELTIVQIIVLKKVHFVKFQSDLLQQLNVWMLDGLYAWNTSNKLLDLEGWILQSFYLWMNTDLVGAWEGFRGLEQKNVNTKQCLYTTIIKHCMK